MSYQKHEDGRGAHTAMSGIGGDFAVLPGTKSGQERLHRRTRMAGEILLPCRNTRERGETLLSYQEH